MKDDVLDIESSVTEGLVGGLDVHEADGERGRHGEAE